MSTLLYTLLIGIWMYFDNFNSIVVIVKFQESSDKIIRKQERIGHFIP